MWDSGSESSKDIQMDPEMEGLTVFQKDLLMAFETDYSLISEMVSEKARKKEFLLDLWSGVYLDYPWGIE